MFWPVMNQTFISFLMYVVYVSNIALILACLIFTILRSTGMLQVQGEYGTHIHKTVPCCRFCFCAKPCCAPNQLGIHRTLLNENPRRSLQTLICSFFSSSLQQVHTTRSWQHKSKVRAVLETQETPTSQQDPRQC